VLEGILQIFALRPMAEVLRDVLDILIVAYVIYRALLVLRGTRAMQMGVGLLVIFLVYLGAKAMELVTLINLMSWLLSSIILVVVVVFQNDIRRALVRVGGQTWWAGGKKQEQTRVLDEVIAAVTELARHRIGALIAFELDANLLEFTKSEGIPIGAAVSRELLVAMFYPESVNKLHDGAIIIRDLKIERAGVFFPMPDVKIRDAALGSRHRAAIGITEETDAVVVVVSEERGTVSVCFDGNIIPNLDGTSLRHALAGLFGDRGRGRVRRLPSAPRPSSAPTSRGSFAPGANTTPTPSPTRATSGTKGSATTTPVRATDVRADAAARDSDFREALRENKEAREGRRERKEKREAGHDVMTPPPMGDRPSPEPRVARERLSVPMPTGGARKAAAATAITPAAAKAVPAPPAPPDEERAPDSRRDTFVPTSARGVPTPTGEDR
jgi:diadenylate cyclase